MSPALVKRLSFIFLFAILLSPFCPLWSRQAQAANQQRADEAAAAARLGVDPLFLAEPAAYLRRADARRAVERTQALAALDRLSRPDPAALSRAQTTADAIKTAHAPSAFLGLAAALETVQTQLAASALPDAPAALRGTVAGLAPLVASGLDDLTRLEAAQRARLAGNALGLERLDAFVVATRADLERLRDYLATQPASAAPATAWNAWLPGLSRLLTGDQAPQRAPAAGPAPTSGVWGLGRAPHATRLAFAMRELARGAGVVGAIIGTPAHMAAASAPPTPADLAETPEVRFSAAVRALAARYAADPVGLFAYVRNTFDTELYYGSKKGSVGALAEQAGNDMDLASLLIAVLRAADIPARYATGVVWLSGQQAQDLTRTTTTQAAADALSTAGIPATYVVRSAGEPVVQIEHTWVQAWLPYERYRGALEQDTGADWIDLDPFIKEYAFSDPVDLTGAPAFDADAFLRAAPGTMPLDAWEDGLRAYIQANAIICASLGLAIRERTIMPAIYRLLPARLPLRQFELLGVFSTVPDQQRYGLTISVQSAQGAVDLSRDVKLPEVYGQRIDVTFPAATPQDTAVISQYGTLYATPPYLINLRPTLSISETVVASGQPVRPGVEREFAVTFHTPGMASLVPEMSHTMSAGGVYVLGLDYQHQPQETIDAATARLAALPAGSVGAEAQRLHVLLARYFREYDRGLEQVTGILRHSYIRDIGAGFASDAPKVRLNFGTPVALSKGFGLIDVPKLSYTPYSETATQAQIGLLTRLIGYHSSAWEHQIIQQAFGTDAISSVKLLQLAKAGGQTLTTITSAGQIPAGLPAEVKATIQDALNRGWHATAPQQPVTRNSWSGVGYITYDPAGGGASYLISGGLNGGEGTGGGSGSGGDCGTGANAKCPNVWDVLMIIVNVLRGEGGRGGGGGVQRGGAEGLAAVTGDIGQDVSAPNGYRGNVNLSNGNLFLQTGDLAVMGVGPAVGVGRSYNSRSARSGMFGPGWLSPYDQRLIIGAGTVVFLDESGAEYPFGAQGGGSYSAPAGFFATLAAVSGGYTLTLKDGAILNFAADGRLTGQRDRNGNAVTLQYDAENRLASVTDASGRVALTFAHTTSGGQPRVERVTDLANRTVGYTYSEGRLTRVDGLDSQTTGYAYDAQGRLMAVTDALGGRTSYAYDGDGRVYRQIDPLGAVTSYAFDSYNGRSVVTDARGSATITSVDAEGRPASVTDPLGNTVTYQRDADHNVTAQTDALGQTTTMTYDGDGNMLSKVDDSGATVSYAYGAFGQVSSVSIDGAVVESHTYDAQGNRLSSTDANGNATSATYDAKGRLLSRTDERGTLTSYAYAGASVLGSSSVAVANPVTGQTRTETTAITVDATGRFTGMQNANGVTTALSTDALGRMTAMAAPDTLPASFTYDALGRPRTMTTRGITQTMTHDAAGRLIASQDSLGQTTTMEYDALGNLIRQVDPTGAASTTAYDAAGRELLRTDALGNTTHLAHCADLPAVCGVVDPNGNAVHTDYDAFGRPIRVTDALDNSTTFRYNAAGWRTAMIDAEGRATAYAYDDLGNLVAVTDALSQTTRFEYLPGTRDAGRDGGFPAGLTKLIDAKDQAWTFEYDSKGRLIREIDPAGKATVSTYDPAGRRIRTDTANGDAITYGYDRAGRLLTMSGALTATMAYDTRGNRTLLENATARLTYGYDAQNRLTRVTNETLGKTLLISYTARGQRATLIDAENGGTQYGYDAAGRLTSVTDPQGGVTSYAYDAAGRRTQVQYPNGVTTTTSYDRANRLTALATHGPDGAVVSAYSYAYDRVGNRTQVVDMDGRTTDYRYDALDRLIEVREPGTTTAFTYDAAGNRLTKTVNGLTTSYAYGPANRLLSATVNGQTTSYVYDENGNLRSQSGPDGATTYTYDAANRLLTLSAPGGRALAFAYDGDGRRVRQTVDGTATWFLLDGEQVLADYAANRTRVARYVHGRSLDETLSVTTSGGTQYLHYDGLGSATRTTDASAAVIGRQHYDAFGAITQSQGWSTRYGFTGREHLPGTDTMYYRSRYYDPSDGRFLSVDSVRGDVTLAPSLHRYTYVHNNPVNYTDPMGTIPPLVFFALMSAAMITTGWLALSHAADMVRSAPAGTSPLDMFTHYYATAMAGAFMILFGIVHLIYAIAFMFPPGFMLSAMMVVAWEAIPAFLLSGLGYSILFGLVIGLGAQGGVLPFKATILILLGALGSFFALFYRQDI